jgi:hypothetical protein
MEMSDVVRHRKFMDGRFLGTPLIRPYTKGVESLMTKVVLLGSAAISVGGVVQSSTKAGMSKVDTTLQSCSTLQVKAKANVSAKISPRHTEAKTMKHSTVRSSTWWAASLLGEPVDGSSN